MISNLRLAGYDHVISVEHEDGFNEPVGGVSQGLRISKRHYYSEKVGMTQ